jgi:glycosyltransferase involved in cell wall biosynthesis
VKGIAPSHSTKVNQTIKRILLLYDSLVAAGGAERLFLEEERILRARGYDVTTVAFELAPKALFDYRPEKLVHLDAKGHFTRLARLLKLIWRLRPDVAVAPSNSEAIYLFLASWLAPIRYAVHVHGSHFWFETDKLKYAWLHKKVFQEIRNSLFGHREFIPAATRMTWRERLMNECLALLDYWAIRKACARVALTNQVAWEIELLYGKKASVCRGCLSQEWLDLGLQCGSAESKRNNSHRVIFSVGRLDPRKRIDVLLRSFAIVAPGNPDLRLIIGGEGPESDYLRNLARELRIEDQVEFCGFILDRDLPSHYLRAEVFAFPSWTTSGITPYEALAFSCKVVWTSEAEEPVLGLPGVHVADPTAADFARGLFCALGDPSRPPLDKLEQYSWNHYFEGVEQVLVQAIGGQPDSLARETGSKSVIVRASQD